MSLSRKNPIEDGGSSGSKTASVVGTWKCPVKVGHEQARSMPPEAAVGDN
jgi:hypothetical protein